MNMAAYEKDLRDLIIKDKIRESLNLYALLYDGPPGKSDRQKWAETCFTKNIILRIYMSDGALDREAHGRDGLLKEFGVGLDTARHAKRHFKQGVVFDELSEDVVKTRTAALAIVSSREHTVPFFRGGGSVPLEAHLMTYHDTWKVEDGLWKKDLSELYYDSGPYGLND